MGELGQALLVLGTHGRRTDARDQLPNIWRGSGNFNRSIKDHLEYPL